MAKISSYPEETVVIGGDFLIGEDITAVATKKIKLSTLATFILGTIYPVGSIYSSTNSANPNTTFGFGSWVAYAQGQVLVGKSATGTFITAGGTGGEENHALTSGENGPHNHGVNDPGHIHYSVDPGTGAAVFTSGSTNHTTTTGSAQQISWGNTTTSASASYVSIQTSGTSTPHNNMPPYVVVYVWTRTA